MTTGANAPLPIRLDGLRVAITAAAGGIGRVMADCFAAAGAKLFVSDIDEVALAECPHPAMRADAGSAADLDRFMEAALSSLGGLDVLINNAGIAGPTKRVEAVDPAELDATLQICLASQFHCARRAVPALREAGGGSIINLSSAAGKFGFPLRSPYAAAKWGVIGFTRTLAIELGTDGIRVNALLPGLVEGPRIRSVIQNKARAAGIGDNEQTERALAPVGLRCFVTQHDIANMALYLASPFGATISGQALSIDGGMEWLA
jgi:NAD(P)-dependent dehydrogenase (short-subunit alcohol dehydrogenase family)